MSYILEALKKSDAERKRGEVPTLSDAPPSPAFSVQPGVRPVAMIIVGIVATLVVGGTVRWLTLGEAASPTPPSEVAQQTATPQATPQTAPEPAPVVAQPLPKPVELPVEPAAEPIAQSAPIVTPEPMPEAKPQVVLEPHPEPEVVAVLNAKPAPAPSVEDKAKPISAPISVAKPAPKIADQAPANLEAPVLPALKTASAYVERAWTSMDKGLYTQAIADLDRAVAQEPAFADAWFARGWANEKNGNETAALRDYTRATDANPAHAFSLFSSGYLHLYGGNPKQAALAFIRARGVATDPALRQYNTLWLYLSRVRAGEDARARLQEDVAKDPVSEQWPGPLVQFFTGEQAEDLVLAAIDQGTKAQRKERRATGYFFLGIAAEMNGDAARARDYFERTLATGAVEFRQYDAAKHELEKLNR